MIAYTSLLRICHSLFWFTLSKAFSRCRKAMWVSRLNSLPFVLFVYFQGELEWENKISECTTLRAVCVCVCTHTCIRTYTHTCTRARTHTHTHTHTHGCKCCVFWKFILPSYIDIRIYLLLFIYFIYLFLFLSTIDITDTCNKGSLHMQGI